MAIYEVGVLENIGSKVKTLERVYSAKNALNAISKMLSYYSNSSDSGNVTITKLTVWGGHGREGTPEYDPNILCECHSSPLWKCSKVLPETVSVESDGISFLVGV
jgi:hypothetical protein|tara:strand:+ start:4259 stop:4573 length:315 start_codon:yes stop_codon:yes gene_type:complete